MIDINKKYRTKNGTKVRILATDAEVGEFCVVGVVGGSLMQWRKNGTNGANSLTLEEDITVTKQYRHVYYREHPGDTNLGGIYTDYASAKAGIDSYLIYVGTIVTEYHDGKVHSVSTINLKDES